MRVARVHAQAKINQSLHVLQRNEETGYHDLVTLFQRIDLADDIVVRTGGGDRALEVTGPAVPAGGLGPAEKNLAYRAAMEFAERAGWPEGFEISLTKNIPVGGGLGGGSADAGAVLRALNALAPSPLTQTELLSIAGTLGSDVPFLATEWIKAIGMGRGTELRNLAPVVSADVGLPTLHVLRALIPSDFVLVVVPTFSIATADAYRWLHEDRAKSGFKLPPLPLIEPIDLDQVEAMSHEELVRWRDADEARTMTNDFEPVVEARFPVLRRIRERLVEKGAFRARLAGSGSCVFGLFHEIPPSDAELGLDAPVLRTRTSTRVVQVQVLE